MPKRPAPLPEPLGSVFSAGRARETGATRAALRGEGVERPFHGVCRRIEQTAGPLPGGELHPAETWRGRQLHLAQTLAPFLPDGYFFCGRTAAVIWGVPVPAHPEDVVEVACFSPRRALRMSGVRGSRVDARLARVVRREGLPVTDVATTWCALAPCLPWRDGVALGDGAIRQVRIPGTRRLKRSPYATLDDLERAANAPYRRGRETLAAMLPVLSPHSASAPESHLRLMLADWGAPTPELDFDVYDSGGRLLGCSEVAFPEFRVAHEYEGDHHRTDRRQWDRDVAKLRDYANAGWDPIRVTAQLMYRDPQRLRRQTFEALANRGWHPPSR
ncbi:MAG: hypothetical protein QM606_09110 [Leucobacter sp.]